jgi:integrase
MKRRGNGDGNITKRSDGRWMARVTVNGESRCVYGKTRTEAAKKLQDAIHDLDRGIATPKNDRLTVGKYLDSWLAVKKPEMEPSAWLRYEQYVRLHVIPILGRVPLLKLNAHQLSALYARKLEDGLAARTVRHLYACIHTALKDALVHDLVVRNIADLVRPPKAPHLDMQTYTPEQANQLLEAAQGDRNEAMYILMLTSACRLGEILGLRWSSLDLERGEMQITVALKDISTRRMLGRPKTPHSRRTIPLTPRAIEALRQHHINQLKERMAHGSDWNTQQLVFCTTNGQPYARSNWRFQQYVPMIEKARLPYIRPHDLRHTAATLLLQKTGQKAPALKRGMNGVYRLLAKNVCAKLSLWIHRLSARRSNRSFCQPTSSSKHWPLSCGAVGSSRTPLSKNAGRPGRNATRASPVPTRAPSCLPSRRCGPSTVTSTPRSCRMY